MAIENRTDISPELKKSMLEGQEKAKHIRQGFANFVETEGYGGFAYDMDSVVLGVGEEGKVRAAEFTDKARAAGFCMCMFPDTRLSRDVDDKCEWWVMHMWGVRRAKRREGTVGTERTKRCPQCSGAGGRYSTELEIRGICGECNGKGRVKVCE